MSVTRWSVPPSPQTLEASLYLAAAKGIRTEPDRPPTPRHAYQEPPAGEWDVWAIIAGRGAGKTFAGTEWILDQVLAGTKRIALVGATSADVRDIMVEGPSGIETRARERDIPVDPQTSRRRVVFPTHNAIAYLYSAEEPDRLRGPQHEKAWCDELAAWKYIEDTWDNLMYGMRESSRPQTMVTTTPRPVHRVREILREAKEPDSRTVATRASLYDNAENLPQAFIDRVTAAHGGTRKGRQEIEGELLEDVEGALWTLATIDSQRMKPDALRYELDDDGASTGNVIGVRRNGADVDFVAVVVGVDPAATSNDESNETGIIVCAAGSDRRGYVLADLSLRGAPLEWANRVAYGYHTWDAGWVVVEVNNGGEMVRQTVKTADRTVRVEEVRASKGKLTRAEPISALYEQGHVSHVGTFPALEDQMANWVPGMVSPDRMDALVWAFTKLKPHIGAQGGGGLI